MKRANKSQEMHDMFDMIFIGRENYHMKVRSGLEPSNDITDPRDIHIAPKYISVSDQTKTIEKMLEILRTNTRNLTQWE